MPDLLSFLGEVALRSSLVLAVAFALLGAMKRASASERHLVMLFGLVVVAFVPVGLLVSPKISWTISLPRQVETDGPTQKVTAYFLEDNKNSLPPAFPPVAENKPSMLKFLTISNGLAALIAGGMLVQMAMLGRAAWSWQRIRRQAVKALLPGEALEQAQVFAGAKTVPPIFASDQITVPLLAGWLRPAILLPTEAHEWPSERLVMVLCHELAHFRRGDPVLLPLICALRVLYWWHPLVWLALARLRRERETACDDLVLNQNFRATDYADLIVSTTRQVQALRWQDGALAMASSSNVGERIVAILNPGLNRRPASRTTVFTGLILAFGIGWFFVAAQIQAEDQPATLGSKATTDPSKPQIKLEFRLIAIDDKTYLSHQNDIDTAVANSDLVSLVTTVNHLPGAALLSAPSVTTQDGLKANIDILREMPYVTRNDKDKDGKMVPSDFKTRDLGLSILALPTLAADCRTVDLWFRCHVSSFGGWKETSPGVKQPIFDTVTTVEKILMPEHGCALWVGGPGTTRAYLPDGNGNNGPPSTNDIAPKRILLLISARSVPAEVQATAIPSNAMVQVSLKYFQISEKTYAQQTASMTNALAMTDALNRGDMSYFSRLPDFDLLAAPAILMKVDEQGVLQAVKKMSYRSNLSRTVPANSSHPVP
jgi:beta-lactamase regulating signal transducer with metallopeptidase domain